MSKLLITWIGDEKFTFLNSFIIISGDPKITHCGKFFPCNLNDFAIQYFKDLKSTYSKGKERKTEIRIFDSVDVKKVVVKNSKLYIYDIQYISEKKTLVHCIDNIFIDIIYLCPFLKL